MKGPPALTAGKPTHFVALQNRACSGFDTHSPGATHSQVGATHSARFARNRHWESRTYDDEWTEAQRNGSRRNAITPAGGIACQSQTTPFIRLNASDEKSKEGNELVLRDDLAADLRQWLADKLTALQDKARAAGEPIPFRLPGDTPLFVVPAGLLRIFNRDLIMAGIPKKDDRGRTLDVHALRTTLSTLMNKAGVAPRPRRPRCVTATSS